MAVLEQGGGSRTQRPSNGYTGKCSGFRIQHPSNGNVDKLNHEKVLRI